MDGNNNDQKKSNEEKKRDVEEDKKGLKDGNSDKEKSENNESVENFNPNPDTDGRIIYSEEWHEEYSPENNSEGDDHSSNRSNNGRRDRGDRINEIPRDDRKLKFSHYHINSLEKMGLIVWALGHLIFILPVTYTLLEELNYYTSSPNLMVFLIFADIVVAIGMLWRKPFFQPFQFFVVYLIMDILTKDLGLVYVELYPNYTAIFLLFIPIAAVLIFMGLISGNIFAIWFMSILMKIMDTYFTKFPLDEEHKIDQFNQSKVDKFVFISAYSNIALSIISQIGKSSEYINTVLFIIMILILISNILFVNSRGSYRVFMIYLFFFCIVTYISNNSFVDILFEYNLNIIILIIVLIDVVFIIVMLVSVVMHALPYLMRILKGLEKRIQIHNESIKSILILIILISLISAVFMLFGHGLVFFMQMASG